MGNLIPESLLWADQIENLKGQTSLEQRAELKAAYQLSASQITNLVTVKACFDQAAIDKVRQAQMGTPSFTLSLNNALVIARLKGKVSDLPTAVHAALDQVLYRRLAPLGTKALVEWIKAGKPAGEFEPKAKTSKKTVKPSNPQKAPTPADKQAAQLIQQLEEASGEEKAAVREKLLAYMANRSPEAKTEADALAKPASGKKSKNEKANPSLFWEWVAGISFFSQLKSKIKKGQTLTPGEKLFVLADRLLKLTGKVLKYGFRLFHKVFKFVGEVFKEFLKLIGIYNYARAVAVILLLVLFVWLALDMGRHGIFHPFRVVWNLIPSHQKAEVAPTAQPAPAVAASTEKLKTASQPKTPPVPLSSHALTFADENKDYLEQELVGVPKHSLIKPYAFAPDSAMGSDMAFHLVMDLQSADKYTVFCGRDKVKVTNVTTGASKISLTTQNGLVSLLAGPSPFNFYWADLKQFHCDVIVSGLMKKYQCCLVIAESKKPLTIQCDSAVDLERLVSALEFYLKLSGAAPAPITPLPYLNQGVRLDNDGEVLTLWTDSPLAKAGLSLGDYIWSMEKITEKQQSKNQIETVLQSLTTGTHTLYKVTADGWKRANANRTPDDPESFRPLRRKVTLQVL